MTEDKIYVTLEQAVALLPEGDPHTFRQGGPCLIGANHERERLIEDMRRAPNIEVTGEQAQGMGHGLAIKDEHGWLFIEARRFEPPSEDSADGR